MSAPKWTPGPWRVKVGDARIHSRHVVGPEGKGKVARLVAEVYGHDENDNLLAAAPDMAEALRAVLSAWYERIEAQDDGCTLDDAQNIMAGALDQARAALRKAGALT